MTITELTNYLIDSVYYEQRMKKGEITEEEITKYLEDRYDAHGMVSGGGKKPDKRIIPVDEDAKKAILEQDKKEFIRGNGMGLGGDNTKVPDMIRNFVRTSVKVEDRSATTFTLSQARFEQSCAFIRRIRQVNPNWNYGDPFDPKILDLPMVDEYV